MGIFLKNFKTKENRERDGFGSFRPKKGGKKRKEDSRCFGGEGKGWK